MYRVDKGATGSDEFTFTLRDANGAESTGRVRVVVAPARKSNSDPVVLPPKATVGLDTEIPIDVLASTYDPDGDPVSLLTDDKEGPTQPRKGKVRIAEDGRLYYRSPAAIDGDEQPDSFSFGVTDGRGGSARGVATVTIRKAGPELQQVRARDDFVLPQGPGSTVDVDVLKNDTNPNGDVSELQVEVVDSPEATVSPDGKLKVKVADRSVAIVYEVTDTKRLQALADKGGAPGEAAAAPADPEADKLRARAVVQIPVIRPEDQLPSCTPVEAKVEAAKSVTVDILPACSDPLGRPLELVRVEKERGGSVKLDGPRAVFTAANEVRAGAGFVYAVSNGNGKGFGVGSVKIIVIGQRLPVEFTNTAVQVPAGGKRTVDVSKLVNPPQPDETYTYGDLAGTTPKVAATLSGEKIDISPTTDAKGEKATLTVSVRNGTTEPVQGMIDVEVTGNEGPPPQAVDDTAETLQEQAVPIDVTANDVDPLGKGLEVSIVGSATGGRADVSGTSVRFTPESKFFGEASFTYQILDETKDAARAAKASVRVRVIGRPSAPGAPTGTSDDKVVKLTWGIPPANGAPITGYAVESDKGQKTDCPSNSCEMTGLTNGDPYRFKVAARNKAITSDDQLVFSEYSPAYIPDAKPEQPAPPTLKFGNQQIDVTWTEPMNRGTSIKDYELRVSGTGLADTKSVGTKLAFTWTGLTNGTSYTFSVRAKNDRDWSEWSSLSSDPVNSIPATVPDAPTAVSAAPDYSNQVAGGWVNLTWQTPVFPADGGAAVNAQEISVEPADVSPIPIPNGTTNTWPIKGLKNGTPYTFFVKAKNKAPGWGQPGQSGQATPCARPDPVSSVAAAAGNRQATVSFSAPKDNGCSISKWEVRYNGPTSALTVSGTPLQGTVSGLMPKDQISFEVRSQNVVAFSDWSPASAAVTIYGDPFAPPNLRSEVSGTSITWIWDAADGNGADIDRYELWLDGGFVGNTGSLNWGRDFGLYGDPHTLAVKAVNKPGLVGPPSTKGDRTSTLGFSVQDDFLKGVCARTDSSNSYILATWPTEANCGSARGVWMSNGSTYNAICRKADGTYQYRNGAQTLSSNVWIKEVNGRWVPDVTLVGPRSSNSLSTNC